MSLKENFKNPKILLPLAYFLLTLFFTLIGFYNLYKHEFQDNYFKVIYVIDGDTIIVKNRGIESKIRLIGINSTEIEHEGVSEECFAKESANYLRSMLLNQTVELKKDKEDKDKYERLLRYVYLDNKNINLSLVKEGFAFSLSIYPNTKFAKYFEENERYAKENKKGIWKACENDPKVIYRV